jgi:hypothetical protein
MTRTRSLLLVACTAALVASGCSHGEQAPASAPAAPAPPAHDHAAGAAHQDHAAHHGGTFFMAPDQFHHLEGTYPEAGLFRLYLYDDHTQPIPPAGFSGRVQFPDQPASAVNLEPDATTQTMVARLAPAPSMPFDLQLWLGIPGLPQEQLFDFRFEKLSDEHAVSAAHDHSHGEPHEHTSPHGGKVVSSGDGHLELVVSGGMAMLFLLDGAEATLPVDDATATLVVQRAAGAPEMVALTPHSTHLMGSLMLAPGETATIVATVRTPTGTMSGRFTMP